MALEISQLNAFCERWWPSKRRQDRPGDGYEEDRRMAEPEGTGSFLLLINYMSEGWYIHRYPSEDALVDGLKMGDSNGEHFLVAQELRLVPLPESQVAAMA